MKYKIWQVWSNHEHGSVLETSRTDEKAAREDVSLITSILHRKAWAGELL